MASVVSAANHTVIVGGSAGLVFTPEKTIGEIGDFVTFIFQSKNHSVTQSGFSSPCALLENATINAVGFDTGFVPVADTDTEFPAWTIELTTKSPIWFYCKQGKHCQNGMVGSINAATTVNKTFEDFKALAMSGAGATATDGALSTAPSVPSPTVTGVGVSEGPLTKVGSSAVAAATSGTSSTNTGTGAAFQNSHVNIVALVSTLALASLVSLMA